LRIFLNASLLTTRRTSPITLNIGHSSIKNMNERLAIYGGIAAAVIIMSTAVFPFWNLFPKMITEKVKVVYVDETGCTVETTDGLIVKIKERRKQI